MWILILSIKCKVVMDKVSLCVNVPWRRIHKWAVASTDLNSSKRTFVWISVISNPILWTYSRSTGTWIAVTKQPFTSFWKNQKSLFKISKYGSFITFSSMVKILVVNCFTHFCKSKRLTHPFHFYTDFEDLWPLRFYISLW